MANEDDLRCPGCGGPVEKLTGTRMIADADGRNVEGGKTTRYVCAARCNTSPRSYWTLSALRKALRDQVKQSP